MKLESAQEKFGVSGITRIAGDRIETITVNNHHAPQRKARTLGNFGGSGVRPGVPMYYGLEEVWLPCCKASSENENWMKCTKFAHIDRAVMVQCETYEDGHPAMAMLLLSGYKLCRIGIRDDTDDMCTEVYFPVRMSIPERFFAEIRCTLAYLKGVFYGIFH